MKESSRKTAIILFVVRFFRLLVSVATLSVSARFFGVGIDRECWILSLNFVTVVNLALWGPLNETFRAKFIFLKANEGEQSALAKASSLFLFTLLLLAVVVVIFEVFSLPIARLIAPAFSIESLGQLSLLLRFLLWSALLSQATQLLSSMLNTYNSFYIPELSGFVSALINFAIILFLSPVMGIYSFVLANYLSLFLLLLVLVYQIRKLKIPLFQGRISVSWSQVKPFILFSIPFFLPYIIGQCNGLIEKSIATMLDNGSVAIIDYSKKITDIVQTVLTSVLLTIMVPVLSSMYSGGNMDRLADESKKYLQLIFLMLAFLVPVLVVCSRPIADILYNKGNISMADLHQISLLIRFYAISLIAVFSYLIFGLILLSVNKNKVYAFYGMIAQSLMILINFTAYKSFGIYTFVIALTVSHLLTAFILFFKLPFSRKATALDLIRYFILIAAISTFTLSVNTCIYSPQNSYLHLIFNSLFVLISGLMIGYLLGLNEIQVLKQLIMPRNKKK